MKIATHIARVLLGLALLFFGLNGLHPFIPQGPMPGGLAGQFLGAMMQSNFFVPIASLMIVSGGLLLLNRFVPLALALVAPILFNIILFHLTMFPGGIAPGLVLAALWIVVAVSVRSAFAGIFQKRVGG
jgi:putative oxidoreductase